MFWVVYVVMYIESECVCLFDGASKRPSELMHYGKNHHLLLDFILNRKQGQTPRGAFGSCVAFDNRRYISVLIGV